VTAIEAPQALVFGLVRDQAQRHRFLPDGWRVKRLLTEVHDCAGAMMELRAPIGPSAIEQVIQIQAISEQEGAGKARSQLVESPPAVDNYITTWTVAEEGGGSVVSVHTEFSYGDMIGEFFVRRRLGKAYDQMLERLKALAESRRSLDTPHEQR
jgi:hypothetical protein